MLTMEARETVAAEAAVPQRESADTGGVTPLFLNDAPGQETGRRSMRFLRKCVCR